MKNQERSTINSLEALQEVFKGIPDYRVLGSILVAAINGKPHREIHDIDLLIDEKNIKEVLARFEKLGFKRVQKHAPGFSWDEFEKPNYLTFTNLLKGSFKEGYFEYRINRWLSLRINGDYLTATQYKLYGLPIKGIPKRSVFEGIKIASLNTKRKIDREVITGNFGSELPDGLSINKAFKVKVFGLNIPYLYGIFSQIYNLIGGVRQKLGKPYDPWQ